MTYNSELKEGLSVNPVNFGDGDDCKDDSELRALFDQTLSFFWKEVCVNKHICRGFPPKFGDGRTADLFKLFLSVRRVGSYESVSKNGMWGFVAGECGLESGVVTCLELIYVKYLKEFDQWLIKGGFKDENVENLEMGVIEKLDLLSRKLDVKSLSDNGFVGFEDDREGKCVGIELYDDEGKENDGIFELNQNGVGINLRDGKTSELLRETINDDDGDDDDDDDDKEFNVENDKQIGLPMKNVFDEELRFDSNNNVEKVVGSQKRRREEESLLFLENLNWVKNDKPWNRALLAKRALFAESNVDLGDYACGSQAKWTKRSMIRIPDFIEQHYEYNLGSCHQAEVPPWTGAVFESDPKWLGTQLWSEPDHEKGPIVTGPRTKTSCECVFPGSADCVRFHIAENRLKIKIDLGPFFYRWKFNQMGDEVSLSWEPEEEERFESIVVRAREELDSSSKSRHEIMNGFWKRALGSIPAKTKQNLVSFYFNVLVLRQRSCQNRVMPQQIDSDVDEKMAGTVGNGFRFENIHNLLGSSKWKSCTGDRLALFAKINDDSNKEACGSHSQKNTKMHPAMHDGIRVQTRVHPWLSSFLTERHRTDPEKRPMDRTPGSIEPHYNEYNLGSCYQAEVPPWTGAVSESDPKWLGSQMWSEPDQGPMGTGRLTQTACKCVFPGSANCVHFHIAENRLKMKHELGPFFYKWKFNQMGEEVSLSWELEEEKGFESLVVWARQELARGTKSRLEIVNGFWKRASESLVAKTKENLVSYYFNVFVLRRRRYQNRATPREIDSDDEEKVVGSVGDRFGYEMIHVLPLDCDAKWKSDRLRNQILLARRQLFAKINVVSDNIACHTQKNPSMHPAMYDEIRVQTHISNPVQAHPSSTEPRCTRPATSIEPRESTPASCYQAEVPPWTGVVSESDPKWLGTQMWPQPDHHNKKPENGLVGTRPRTQTSCGCTFPGSANCVRFHIAENRLKIKLELGPLFYKWKFNQMGEEVSLIWEHEEEEELKTLIVWARQELTHSTKSRQEIMNGFWKRASETLVAKTKENVVSYYFNVFVVRRRSYQNRVMPQEIDSDDDEQVVGSFGDRFGYEMVQRSPLKCSENLQCFEL